MFCLSDMLCIMLTSFHNNPWCIDLEFFIGHLQDLWVALHLHFVSSKVGTCVKCKIHFSLNTFFLHFHCLLLIDG